MYFLGKFWPLVLYSHDGGGVKFGTKSLFWRLPLIALMRSGKIEAITRMGVNSSAQDADTVEGLGEVNIPLQMAAKHHPDQTFLPI